MSTLIEPQLFVTAKSGERIQACQDVGWFSPSIGPGEVGGFAVADGATGGWDGQRWAELTVAAAAEALVEAEGLIDDRWVRLTFGDALERARTQWLIENSSANNDDDDPIRALARTKFLATGGHCTLTAGTLVPGEQDTWQIRAISVGDSPIVHLRPTEAGYHLVTAAPLHRSEQFKADPKLVTSRSGRPGTIAAGMSWIDIEAGPGDVLLVMTDALAAWALERHEQSVPAWDVLVGLDLDGFTELVGCTRQAGELVDDDVLLLRMAVAEGPYRSVAAVDLTGAGTNHRAARRDKR